VEHAKELESKIRGLSTVSEVDSIAGYLDEDVTKKLALVSDIKQLVIGLKFAPTDPSPVYLAELSQTLSSLNGFARLAIEDTEREHRELAKQLRDLSSAAKQLNREMFQGSSREEAARAVKLGAYQRALFNDLRKTFGVLARQDDTGGIRVQDLPESLRSRFVGVSGKFVLQVYPRKNVWQREDQREFIHELREALDPDGDNHPVITGTPVQLYEYTGLLKRSYEEAALYALAAIAILVFVHFRSLLSLMLALLPVAVGTLWLGGIMGFFGIAVNPANIMTLPLVIGIGVTNGIHILNRFAEEQSPGILSKSTGKAVLVSGLTTIAGFGSLILAKHQGIQSLGLVMSTGVATCMISGITFLPAVLKLLRHRGGI